MKRKFGIVGIALAICLLLTTVLSGVVVAKAEKLDLRSNPPWCDVPAEDQTVVGFVVLNNDNETDEVVVVVSLKDGAPNRTYGVFLEEYNGTTGGRGNWVSWYSPGTLTTNGNGHGNFDVRVPRDPGTYYLQIVVSYPWGSWEAQSFGTDIAAVTIR